MVPLELQESNSVLASSWTVGSRSRVFSVMEDPLAFGLENLFKIKTHQFWVWTKFSWFTVSDPMSPTFIETFGLRFKLILRDSSKGWFLNGLHFFFKFGINQAFLPSFRKVPMGFPFFTNGFPMFLKCFPTYSQEQNK